MRLNIKNIMEALNCDESTAEMIENTINESDMLDWSECTHTELAAAAREANEMYHALHLVITSRRFETDVIAYGPIQGLINAQSFMLELAKRIDDCPLAELEDNYHIDTENFFLDITTLSEPK